MRKIIMTKKDKKIYELSKELEILRATSAPTDYTVRENVIPIVASFTMANDMPVEEAKYLVARKLFEKVKENAIEYDVFDTEDRCFKIVKGTIKVAMVR